MEISILTHMWTHAHTHTHTHTLTVVDWRSGGEVALTGLTPSTEYSISVAAVNENGNTGVYSDPVTTLTSM